MPVLFPGLWLGYQVSELILNSMHIPRDLGRSLTISLVTMFTSAIAVNTAIMYALVMVIWKIRNKPQAS
jgi:hypothetical protein